jgi:hypothetical protein
MEWRKMRNFKAVTVGITLNKEDKISGPSSFLKLLLYWVTANTEEFFILTL